MSKKNGRKVALDSAHVLGRNIRRIRASKNKTAAEVARVAGLQPATFSRLENGISGSRGPCTAQIDRVAEALDTTPSELLQAEQ